MKEQDYHRFTTWSFWLAVIFLALTVTCSLGGIAFMPEKPEWYINIMRTFLAFGIMFGVIMSYLIYRWNRKEKQ